MIPEKSECELAVTQTFLLFSFFSTEGSEGRVKSPWLSAHSIPVAQAEFFKMYPSPHRGHDLC